MFAKSNCKQPPKKLFYGRAPERLCTEPHSGSGYRLLLLAMAAGYPPLSLPEKIIGGPDRKNLSVEKVAIVLNIKVIILLFGCVGSVG